MESVTLQTILDALFSPNENRRCQTAFWLYAPDGHDSPYLPSEDEPRRKMATLFLTVWNARELAPTDNSSLALAIQAVLSLVRETPVLTFSAAELAVALRPIRILHLGELTEDVCQTLYDFYRGRWTAKLSRPDHYTIQTAIATTLVAIPPHQLAPFWNHLQKGKPLMQRAMRPGLEYLRAGHAVSSLLCGLTICTDHALQGAIVDCLEQIASPECLPILHRLRRETATTDWTLSRHLARAIAVIERQNIGQYARILLRPTTALPEDPESLLRPFSEDARREWERQTLLRLQTAETPQDTPTV